MALKWHPYIYIYIYIYKKMKFKHLKSLGVTENVNTIFRLPTSYSARIKSFGNGKTLFPLACNYIACSTKWRLFESSVQCVVGWDCNFRRNKRLIWHNIALLHKPLGNVSFFAGQHRLVVSYCHLWSERLFSIKHFLFFNSTWIDHIL